MQLSTHFNLLEFEHSNHRDIPNKAGQLEVMALEALCDHILEPIREKFGPVRILSGFRSKDLNQAVKGAPNSQHTKGEAADITVPGVENATIWQFIVDSLPYDQVIAERLSRNNGTLGWVHVSYNENHRKDALSCISSGQYLHGLHFVE